jgi:hypothetical protein
MSVAPETRAESDQQKADPACHPANRAERGRSRSLAAVVNRSLIISADNIAEVIEIAHHGSPPVFTWLIRFTIPRGILSLRTAFVNNKYRENYQIHD